MEQADDDVFLQDDLSLTIAEHALQCNYLFRKCMKEPGLLHDPTVIDDQLARFTLWGSNMDIYGPLNVSLDYRLRYSPTVVQIIHQLLDVICDALKSLKSINETPQQSPSRKKQRTSWKGDTGVSKRADDDLSDLENHEDQAQENLSVVNYTIAGTVTRLFRLSNAIRKSAATRRTDRIGRYTQDEEANNAIAELRLYTECYIRFRFPEAPESLRTTLIEANALRLRRLFYQRSHRRRISLSTQKPEAPPRTVQLPQTTEKPQVVRFAASVRPKRTTVDQESKALSKPPAPVTYATTAQQTAVAALYANSTVEVPRAKSVHVNNKLSFPPVPTTSECPYCGVVVEFTGKSGSTMWHDHVIRDLEPFVCVFAHCDEVSQKEPGSLTFETSKAWMNHLQNAHGFTWECRAPSHGPMMFEQEVQYQEHSHQEHGVPEAHVATLSNAARRSIVKNITECPFGDDFHSPETADINTVFSSEGLRSHVAAHMKEIALLTLQKLPNDDDTASENVDSDQPLEDAGVGFAKLRESMCSVLDDEALDLEFGNTEEMSDHRAEPHVERLDLEERDERGLTDLHHAVRTGNPLLVQSLLDKGHNLRSRANDGSTALHYAVLASQQDLVTPMMELLMCNDHSIALLTDRNGRTPLHYAAEKGNPNATELLIRDGADLNVVDAYGFTPIIWAVVAGQKDVIEVLLHSGVEVNSTSTDGRSALCWAAGLGHSSIVELLLRCGADIHFAAAHAQMLPLGAAASIGDIDTARLLLTYGADVDHRDRDGWSAIHWAAEEGHLEVVRMLLDSGANVNGVSSFGTSAMHCAANGGHQRIVELLLKHGADFSKSTCHGWTPLHHAAYMGHSHLVHYFLKEPRLESIASQQDNHGWTMLHLAIYSRDPATVITSLQSAVVVESRFQCDESGLTAEEWLDLVPTSHAYKSTSNLAFGKSRCCRVLTRLRHAVVNNNFPMAELLSYDVNGTDSGRRTALYYAVKEGLTSMVEMLLGRGADPNVLPVGRTTWEEITSDDMLLTKLREAGYRRRNNDPELKQQMMLALKGKGQRSIPEHYEVTRSPLLTRIVPEPANPTEGSRRLATSLWKRLRGQ